MKYKFYNIRICYVVKKTYNFGRRLTEDFSLIT